MLQSLQWYLWGPLSRCCETMFLWKGFITVYYGLQVSKIMGKSPPANLWTLPQPHDIWKFIDSSNPLSTQFSPTKRSKKISEWWGFTPKSYFEGLESSLQNFEIGQKIFLSDGVLQPDRRHWESEKKKKKKKLTTSPVNSGIWGGRWKKVEKFQKKSFKKSSSQKVRPLRSPIGMSFQESGVKFAKLWNWSETFSQW